MIKSVAEFLEELKKNGIELIKTAEYVNHSGLIGDMYEGLTSSLLDRAIFDGLNLKIASGKVKNNSGQVSSQIDCMLVVGDGEEIPFTNKKIYHYRDVIAVLEVKKNLNKNEILDSFTKMKSISNVSSNADYDGESYMMEILESAWTSLTNTHLPKRKDVDKLPEYLQYVYHTLFMEAFLPLRIVFGYFGYNTEYALRNGFVNMLSEKANKGGVKGFGIGSFPSLVINGNSSLIKANGMPNAVPFHDEDFFWSIFLSSNKNPLLNLLEVIWTRLSYKFGIPSTSIFDDDLNIEFLHRFIDCKFEKLDTRLGWSYNYIELSAEELNLDPPETKWEPVEISKPEFVIVNLLCSKSELEINNELEQFAKQHKINLEEMLQRLHNVRLIFYDKNKIWLSTKECVVGSKNGKMYAGENVHGLMTKWLLS